MAKPFDPADVADLLGLGSHSVRKSYYPELAARLDELEQERNRYKWLFEHAVHGIFQARLNAAICAANPAFARMLGYQEPAQIVARADLVERLFAGGAGELGHIRQVLRDKHGLFSYETRLLRQDGSAVDVMMNLLYKPDEGDLVEGFVADITERKQAQRRLLQLNDELEQRVAKRTEQLLSTNRHLQQEIAERERMESQLREARDIAEDANRSKDKFLAAASHDLLQPMNAARLLISTLRERDLPLAEQVLIERSHQALESAEDMLSDLLDISRLDQAAVKPDLDTYSLDELLSPLASEFQSVAEAAGLRLKVRFPEAAVRTDGRLLSRILRNLLSNACRYTQEGGILLGARRRGDQIRIEVRDTGRGIPADQLEAIFLEFNQLDLERGHERKGVGLGLAIVDRIAGILDYRVQVRSEVGRGSTFWLDLPSAALAPAPDIPSRPLPSLGDPLPGCRVLVIDNEASILTSMAALLGQWGCSVLTARDEREAFEVLQERPPEVILADYHLDDGVVGSDVIKQLRQRFASEIPVAMITADRSDLCLRELHAQGVPLLNKPVKPGKLRAVLTQLLTAKA
ncbi:PAS domain-containing hybrid sensor histidine kinase/response regulator [Stutzerimonas tarimensis]|uniref:histidine kinase n=1 Tax=Stutzerimonas tarimensis TaxID=1507735 RepID=A0ABV7T2Z3_9GAMM